MRCTLVSNKIKNPSKITESHNSKDSVIFVTTSGEAKCVTSEMTIQIHYLHVNSQMVKSVTNVLLLKHQFQINVANLYNQVVQKRSHQKYPVTNVTSNTQSTCKQPSGQKSSKKTTPKVVSNKCVTSETSVSNKHGQSLPPSVQKSSKKTTPKVVSDKCITSKISVSNKHGQSLPPSVQKSSKKTTLKVVSDKCVPSETSGSNT